MAKPSENKQFCSRECTVKASRGRRVNYVDLNCQHCGVEFSLPEKTAESSDRKYCRKACFLAATKAVKVQRECAECGSSFDLPQSQLKHKHGKYCSNKCKYKGQAKAVSGEGSGRYIHGECISHYSVYFPVSLRRAIRARDGNRCRLCGLNGDNHDTKLPVHHINYDKMDDRLSNLITLCKYCHGTMHGNLEARAKCEKELSHLLNESDPQMSLFTTLKPGTTITSLTAS
jgi:5-methylcytosine-specific restriction endonuclease McrA